ncbi:DUF58 domain-containing protein [Actinotalea sp. K2]|uniref:DUF58 domain-containing protein n=1 Tax=Actinotalea sp. K2 TaxID=2939438 RepID=UPI002017FDD7|nr:DUF58 domain-containing protein [Actinotalea sp. K2]MCL3861652.1 DUF58 domain-containing protein [Actinotalea sp. K2]
MAAGQGGGRGPGEPWVVDERLAWTLGAGMVLLVLGVLAGRPDVALLGVAPVVASLWAWGSRPRGEVWVDAERTRVPGPDGAPDSGSLTARLHLAAPPGTEAVRVRVGRPGHTPVEALVHVPVTRQIEVAARSVRTGPQPLFSIDHQGLGRGSHVTGPAGTSTADQVLVLPRARPLADLPLPARLRGLTGHHESRRPGEGGGLRDIHPFAPGDSLRRVDWRTTARRSPGLEQLYVRRTVALAEAMVTLVVDSRDDVGPDPATWSGMLPVRPDDATSLDLARQAAASIAQASLATGDRVGLEDLGVRLRALRPGAGRRQLDRVVHQLAVLRPLGEPTRRVRPPVLPSGSIVYVFSTFLDPEAARLAVVWRRSGHRVVAVDVLPPVRVRGTTARERLALRIVMIEREDRLADLTSAGAEVVVWSDTSRASARLQQLARRSHRRPGSGGGR